MLSIPSNSSINSSWSNIRFRDGNYNLLSSWIESYSTSSAIVWVMFPNGISAHSAETIYMETGNLIDNFFDGITVGEAPQLSGTYGQYDNGAKVFSFYENFAGTALNSRWTAAGSVSTDNGITMTYHSIIYASYAPPSTGAIYESLFKYLNSGNDYEVDAGFGGITSLNPTSGYATYNDRPPLGSLYYANGSQVTYGSTYDFSEVTGTFYITGLGLFGSTQNILLNDSIAVSNTDTTYSLSQITTIYLQQNGGIGGESFTQWVRVRAYPPNGTMLIQVNKFSNNINILSQSVI